MTERSAPRVVPLRPLRVGARAVVGLAVALVAGVLLSDLLINPPMGDLRAIAWCFFIAGVISLAAGGLALRLADHALGFTIRTRAVLSAAVVSGVSLLNVLIFSRLMFINTSHDLKLLLAVVVFSGVLTVFFSTWVASAISGRLEQVMAGVGALAGGEFSAPVTVSGSDEVARLGGQVNALAARLRTAQDEREALERERRELTASISHDLRTPLASLRAMVEALDDGVVDDLAEVARYHGTMRREVDRLARLIDDLFELARLDAGALQLQCAPVGLQEIAAEVVDAMQARATQLGITLSLEVAGDPPPLLLDGARMERAAGNLVRNALEHTPAGGTVHVEVSAEPGAVLLRVADTGEGIDSRDLPRIWERFYRAEQSRERTARGADGAGLGLAIARGFIEAHGGAVTVQSVVGRGTTFSVRIAG